MTDKDRRECVRFPTLRNVNFRVGGGRVYLGLMKNKGEAFIETGERCSEGQDISMTFVYPKFGSEKRTGKIVRVTPRGIGVKFTQADIPDKRHRIFQDAGSQGIETRKRPPPDPVLAVLIPIFECLLLP